MDNKNYALTKEALAYMGAYEAFYDLYCSYKDILVNVQEELHGENENPLWSDEIKKFASKRTRQLFNDFFKQYSYLFIDKQYIFHVNSGFMSRMDLFDIKKVKPLTLDISFISFESFLVQFEKSVLYLIKSKKEKEFSHSFNEDAILKDLNNRIEWLRNGGKSYQCVDFDNRTTEDNICEEITIYHNLQNISCNQKKHKIVSSYSFFKLNNDKIIRLPAHYCSICNKYFIGIESLKIYEKIYGNLIVMKRRENECCLFKQFGESELYQTGYNAQENGMTEQDRKAHLKFLIDTGKMEPYEIIRDLESAINLHKNKYKDRFAVDKWRKDLEYANEFIVRRNAP